MLGLKGGKMENKSVKSLTQIALMVSFLAVVSQLSIPTLLGVPFTIQIFAVGLIGYLFNTGKSLITVGVYIALGAVGAPIFANFGGGLFYLFGYTGGFIWGFLLLAFLCSLNMGKMKIPLGILGVIVCHFIGALQYSLIGRIPLFSALIKMSALYILKDFVLIVLSYFLAKAIKKYVKIN